MNMPTAEQRLAELGLELPPPPAAVASYEPWVRAGNMLYTSGQLPWRDGKTLLFKGSIGQELTVEQGYEACKLSTLNAIAQLKDAVGDLERVRRIVRLEGSINIARGHTDDAPKVLNGASETLNAVFGERGRHSRMIYTFPEMLLGVACLIVLWAEVD
jgi:enamine deaminase RidA (YjgF/YER057c/UK114 family)